MKEVGSLQGEAMALSGIAKASEYLANMGKACEALEAVSCCYCCCCCSCYACDQAKTDQLI